MLCLLTNEKLCFHVNGSLPKVAVALKLKSTSERGIFRLFHVTLLGIFLILAIGIWNSLVPICSLSSTLTQSFMFWKKVRLCGLKILRGTRSFCTIHLLVRKIHLLYLFPPCILLSLFMNLISLNLMLKNKHVTILELILQFLAQAVFCRIKLKVVLFFGLSSIVCFTGLKAFRLILPFMIHGVTLWRLIIQALIE